MKTITGCFCLLEWDLKDSSCKQLLTFVFVLFVNYTRTGVQNILVLAYPQINVVPLCIPPNKNLIQIVPPGQKISKETAVSSLFFVHERPEHGLYYWVDF
jgi:hypothetical protein